MGRATGEISRRGFGFALGVVFAMALGISALGFAVPADGRASGAVSHGEGQLSVNPMSGLAMIDLCKWEPMSCERCLVEPWSCNGEPECWIEPWYCIKMVPVNVEKHGSGLGTVTSSPAGINCGPDCSEEFPEGTAVTLTAKAGAGSKFTGWSGGGCASSGTDPCKMPLVFAYPAIYPCVCLPPTVSVTATFELESKPKTFGLTVSKTGTGSGTVKSIPAGIDCGGTCTAEFEEGKEVKLRVGATAGSIFSGWKGCDVDVGRECRVTVDGAEAVRARFTEVKALSAQKEGAGAGSVTTSPGGIVCPMACSSASALFPTGKSVAVVAAPAKGSVFTGWGGACSGVGACTVTMSESKSVTAEFAPLPKRSLTLNKEGSGAGIVKSLPSTFGCGTSCASQASSFDEGTVVALMPTPAKGSVFSGWTGACSGTGACTVALSEAKTVGAAFALVEGKPTGPTKLLTVGKAEGTGTGTVGSYPGGIACYGGCTNQSARFKEGAVVALEATPGRGSTFTEWGGACSGSGSCEVTMSEARSVTAVFTAIPAMTLTLNKTGEGWGVVLGKPSFGISCRFTCTTATAFFPQTTTVSLNAISGRGVVEYIQWEGCDNPEGVQCIVTGPGDREITVKFE